MNLIETYELIDAQFVDHGTSTDYAASGWAYTNINRTRDNDTQLTQTDSSTAGTYRLLNFNGDYCFEFDIKLTGEGSFYVNFRKSTSGKGSVLDSVFRYPDSNYHHVKLAAKGSTVKVTVDGESKNSVNLSDTWDRFYFNLTSGVTVNYKDFCYYPI